MSSPVVLDVIVIAALLLAVWLGCRKGFVLSLCSLLAVVVALVGSHFLADSLSPKLAVALEPRLTVSIQAVLEEAATELTPDGTRLDPALTALEEKGGVYQWAAQVLDTALSTDMTLATAHAAAMAASAIASRLAHGLILTVSFLVLLILWRILSHTLNLVAHLPVLTTLNRLGGGAFGLAKGLLLVWLVTWAACDLSGIISPAVLDGTHLLRLVDQYSPFHMMLV